MSDGGETSGCCLLSCFVCIWGQWSRRDQKEEALAIDVSSRMPKSSALSFVIIYGGNFSSRFLVCLFDGDTFHSTGTRLQI
jgi:hypothetical protein